MAKDGSVGFLRTQEVRHPIKAATLLYTAPPFIMRGPIYLIALIMVAAIAYMTVATKWVVVAAPLVLERESVTVEALGRGVVEQILVAENQSINAGERLITIREALRETETPEQERLRERSREVEEAIRKIENETEFTVRQLEARKEDTVRNRETRLTSLDSQLRQLDSQLAIARQSVGDAQRRLNLARESLNRAQTQLNNRDITRPQFEQAQEAFDTARSSVTTAQANLSAIEQNRFPLVEERESLIQGTAVDQIDREIEQAKERERREVGALNVQLDEVTQQLIAIEGGTEIVGTGHVSYDGDLATYRSGLDGVVTSVPVRQGQIVSVATPVATVVKQDAPLVARALIQNHDIGKIKTGQTVNLKYFAYPYQEWGIQEGRVIEIATTPGTVPGFENLYEVRIALLPNVFSGEVGTIGGGETTPRERPLEIGLEGIAEIYTDQKRWIELIFRPLGKFFENEDDEGA